MTSTSARVFKWHSPLSLSVCFLLLLRHQSLDLEPTLIQCPLILTSYICKDHISKEGHILGFWVDMNFGGHTIKPTTVAVH